MKFFRKLILMTAFVVGAYGLFEKNLLLDWTFQIFGSNLNWPCTTTKNIYVQSGRYIPKNIIASRIQIYKDSALILTPRYKPGVPFTVGSICMSKGYKCQPLISPFPCWAIHEEGNEEAIQNAVDIFLDPMDILWVLDIGVVNTLEQPVRRAPPKVWAFDVKTGKVSELKILFQNL